MRFFKYFFYRVYRFYNKRWPNSDPEGYAWYAVFLFAIYWLIGVTVLFSNISFVTQIIAEMDWLKSKPAIIAVGLLIIGFFYWRFLYKKRYLSFCNDAYFEHTYLRNRTVAKTALWLYTVLPFILIILGIIIKKSM
ncbi:hypothetical protein NIASO_05630 [Niabella soli DSM 19437]|uniref:Uncharacterized protein n=1 Tax=Niabella soli DSM 19437 TaxID=929713 RepID=W0F2Q4_9BACT|nr:hypothetical protein NIASO_05630 [Niabella soli DSM 19437]